MFLIGRQTVGVNAVKFGINLTCILFFSSCSNPGMPQY